jgi:hypothetical protein
MVGSILRNHMVELRRELKASQEQLDAYRHIKKGTLVYAEHLHINIARDGVGDWYQSYKPALLRYVEWTFSLDGFTLRFDVLASEDPEPYRPPWQPEYSGKEAHIQGPEYYDAKKIKIVPITDLPLYINYPYKTALFDKLLKKGLGCTHQRN